MNVLSDEEMAPLTPASRQNMLDVILSWASYDAMIGQWLAHAYKLPLDDSTLLIGNMDTRTKLDRLKLIYEHHRMARAAESVERLKKKHAELVFIRNHIAHSICKGTLKSDRNAVAFTPFKASKGSVGYMAAHIISLADMRVAVKFARDVAKELNKFNGGQKAPLQGRPPEPPLFE